MIFHSKIDTWLAIVLWLASAVIFAAGISTIPFTTGVALLAPVSMICVGIGIIWTLFSTRYSVGHGHLQVNSGPFRWHVAISEITKITPTRSAISGPALSLDRLRIDYKGGKKSILVSPLSKQQFIRAIEAEKNAA